MKINLSNNIERNYHGITSEQQEYLINNEMSVYYDDCDEKYTIYDKDGNDIDIVSDMKNFEF